MSSKYEPGETPGRVVRDSDGEIALTNHAFHRFRERTPHDCRVGIRDAWVRGEDLRHPAVAGGPSDSDPESARIYRHNDEWGVVFVIMENDNSADRANYCDRVVATVTALRLYDGASSAYLHAYGPHGPVDERGD